MSAIHIQPCTDDDWAELAIAWPEWAAMRSFVTAPQARCFSGRDASGVLLGAAGVILYKPQQAYCWGAFLAERWPRVPGSVLRAIRATMACLIAEHDLRRLEARADACHVAACRFLESLGFCCEGLARAANQYGEDQFLFAYCTPEALVKRDTLLFRRYGDLADQALAARKSYVVEGLERE